MRIRWKRLLLTSLTLGLLGSATAYAQTVSMNLFYNGKNHAYKAEEVRIEIDGKELVPKDMPAVIIEERTMLPMRLIAQELGCEVTWNEEARQAYVVNDDYTIVFGMDSKIGYQNGKEFTMDVPATVVNDRTMLPVRALAKALELEITWDDPSRTVSITTAGKTTEQPAEPENPTVPDTPNVPTAPSGAAVTLNKVSVPARENAGQVFAIQANGPISGWEETYVDDKKIVLDFYNAKSGLAEKITATNSSIVSAIRTAPHNEDGVAYVRVVFDLTAKKNYEITQSSDRTQLFITFDKVTVEEVSIRSRNDVDYITISADGALGANVFTLSKPNRIVVDLPNVESDIDKTIDVGELNYVTDGRVGQFAESTLRIVFEVGDLTEYSYQEGDYDLKLEIRRSTLEHMIYDSDDETLYLDKEEEFDTDDVEIEDHYLDGYALVRLPGDFEDVYGYGTYRIGGDILNTIQVSNVGGDTVFRFNQNRINVYEIEDEGDRYAIQLKNPRDVYDNVLLLDAGHGGKDPGTSGNGLVEKNLTLTLLQKVDMELRNSDIKVYLTRNSDVYPENNTRAKTANDIAHMMVSIHMNAAAGNPLPNGTETLYQVHAGDGRLTSKRLAEILLNHIISATGNNSRGIKLRDDLLILNGTTVPTVIIETVFLSNAGDALKISDSAYQDKVARAIADGIIEAMELK